MFNHVHHLGIAVRDIDAAIELYAVDDITATLADLRSQGYELIDEVPRPGFGGHLIASIKPGSTMGALWELVQE